MYTVQKKFLLNFQNCKKKKRPHQYFHLSRMKKKVKKKIKKGRYVHLNLPLSGVNFVMSRVLASTLIDKSRAAERLIVLSSLYSCLRRDMAFCGK